MIKVLQEKENRRKKEEEENKNDSQDPSRRFERMDGSWCQQSLSEGGSLDAL